MTGQHSHINRVRCWGQPLSESAATFPHLFQQAGYQTALYGKWHLKSIPQGFDDFKVLKVQGRYRDPQFVVKHKQEIKNVYADPEYAGDVRVLKQKLDGLKKKFNDLDEVYPELQKVRQAYW
ncbi:sulfatase-like hydrolase/transferase [candidate division KSB1 bacterium]|nr:sulfatase-like hydrolase/transferase [candidate division KSB1 bacterium]